MFSISHATLNEQIATPAGANPQSGINPIRFAVFLLFMLAFGVQSLPASYSQAMAEGGPTAPVLMALDYSKTEDPKSAMPVVFAGSPAPNMPVALPTPKLTTPFPQPAPANNALMVTRMNGEIHLKHLGGPRLEPSRALHIETGAGQSWCEFKMQSCIGRTSKDSEVSVFPDSNTIYLKKGSIIVRVRGEGGKYSVIAGDLLCRIQSTTLRVQQTDRAVSFQVLEGTITVCNRKTGEVYTASQVVQPIK